MSLDSFGAQFPQEHMERFGETLLKKYGIEACEAAGRLDDAPISSGSARTYKPQIRQVVSELEDKNPSPREVANVIGSADKQSSTKNVMVEAMKKYYTVIGERDKSDMIHTLAKEQGLGDIDFNKEMQVEEWITKDEVLLIEDTILPPSGDRTRKLDFGKQKWVITMEHKALVMALFYTGCRVGEICARYSGDEALTVEDLYPESEQIELYRLKKKGNGYKRDMKVVPQKLWDVLEEYLDEYDISEGPIFPFVKRTAQNRIKDINEVFHFAYAGFEHMDTLTPHKFRHGRVTDLANNAGIEQAGQYVEHSSTDITNAYRHLAVEQQKSILPEEQDEGDEADIGQIMEALGADGMEDALEKIKKLED